MNQHLQAILNMIQQDESITAEQKNTIIKSLQDADKELEITAFKLERTEKVKRTTEILLEETIEELEQKRTAVEAQNRELEIEAALQRVRTVAMSMSKPDDLLHITESVFKELQGLGFTELRNAIIQTFVDDKKYLNDYDFSDVTGGWISRIPYTGHPIIEKFVKNIRTNKEAFVETVVSGKEMEEWKKFRKANGEVEDPRLNGITELFYYHYSIGEGDIGISTFSSISIEKQNLLKRFRNVFDLAYQRYTDIKKAEAQAKESQIQLALERVRARTMAMQKSNELGEAASLLFKQVSELGIKIMTAGFNIWNTDISSMTAWMTDPTGNFLPPYNVPLNENRLPQELNKAKLQNKDFLEIRLNKKQLKENFEYLSQLPDLKAILGSMDFSTFQLPNTQVDNYAFFAQGNLMFITYEPCPEAHDIFKRFAKVFEQTYTRFLDLQKAEAQTREAQIEVAVERVRAKALAMHKSEDLHSVVVALKKELMGLRIPDITAATIYLEQNGGLIRVLDLSDTAEDDDDKPQLQLDKVFRLEDTDPDLWIRRMWNRNENYFVLEADQDDFVRVVEWIRTDDPVGAETAEKIIKEKAIKKAWLPTVKLEKGVMNIDLLAPPAPEIENILLKMGAGFDLAYKRFLDLQKAEAQAREAQIEVSLERIRSVSMTIRKSNELFNIVHTVFGEWKKLGLELYECNINLLDRTKKEWINWGTGIGEAALPRSFHFPWFDDPFVSQLYEDTCAGISHRTYFMEGMAHHEFLDGMFSKTDFKNAPEEYRKELYNIPRLYLSHAFMQYGSLDIVGSDSPSETIVEILKRFAKVFEQAYTRYLDVVQAEAQAKEAQIELGLERVRARAMAMQKSHELKELINTVSFELGKLDILLDRCFIVTYDTATMDSTWWMANPETPGESIGLLIKYHEYPPYLSHIEAWKQRKLKWEYILEGETKKIWDTFLFVETDLSKLPPVVIENMRSKEKVYLSASFNNFGYLSLATLEPLTEQQSDIMLRFAKVFDLTYTRFNDLQKAEAQALRAEHDLIAIKEAKQKAEEALTELQATQKQLIQSEKMASLGELTAGIAHEIQNPLNFVNNFSEVSKELLDEMKEAFENGDTKEAKAIMKDVIQNLEKINQHGKRADGIVKGMLQHSRSSSNQKEPTDINKLADEYLRLAYHGLRAKDKSFNATMETDFDETIGNINIIPQDIGRVILNLITNAFYAACLPPPIGGGFLDPDYKHSPTVWVTTKKEGHKVLISVRDNGPGISQKIIDKIFQPFFTTKPTGQGTGLGLSLSYDIVKAHGGEIKVETKKGEGTEFVIQLPVV